MNTRTKTTGGPLNLCQLRALSAHLQSAMLRKGCDDSLARTKAWLLHRGLNVDAHIEWLRNNGGYCDCEVLVNVCWRKMPTV